ncbi:hypothetical protein BCR32DRAFT_324596 [Anaeromyces robustus]|jgi:hypothetical protein|uniref:Inorganic phosphate transport PHO88 n=1 Tax=Anaeromyces robustus TaxID=1754192 RepID=A0A1Y1XP58_9FUNG|nr:hypothetical protein BCR32DRAFT_324596 [Anaeromyces robustus]|eukprot:ORX87114.1 hypothetical protein BCR32DRAFT_324596 [Anaeromyces robustus]
MEARRRGGSNMTTAEKFRAMNTPQNRAIFSMFMMFFLMHFISRIDFDVQPRKTYLICAYAFSQIITLVFAGLIYLKINKVNDKNLIHIRNTGMVANAQNAAEGGENNEVITQTIREYDLGKCKQMVFNVAMTVGFSTLLYYKFNMIRPLAIQSALAIKNLYEQPLVRIHLLGKPATGELARPFNVNGLFGQKEEALTDKDVKRMEKKKN